MISLNFSPNFGIWVKSDFFKTLDHRAVWDARSPLYRPTTDHPRNLVALRAWKASLLLVAELSRAAAATIIFRKLRSEMNFQSSKKSVKKGCKRAAVVTQGP